MMVPDFICVKKKKNKKEKYFFVFLKDLKLIFFFVLFSKPLDDFKNLIDGVIRTN